MYRIAYSPIACLKMILQIFKPSGHIFELRQFRSISCRPTQLLYGSPTDSYVETLCFVYFSFTVAWRVGVTADSYKIRLILKDTNEIIEEDDQVAQNSITFRNVTVLQTYIVEIR